MNHNWEKYFDTKSEYWKKIQKIYKENDNYPKIVVSDRNLHHKFLRTFSRLEGTEVDNDKDNLVSLSLPDHLRVHYYLWKCTRTGFKNRTAPPVRLMLRKALSSVTEETVESIISDWDCSILHLKNPKLAEYNRSRKGVPHSEEHNKKVREACKKYDVEVVNIATLEKCPQRNGRELIFDTNKQLSNENVVWEHKWVRAKEILVLNTIFKVNFLEIGFEDRVQLVKMFQFLKTYYKKYGRDFLDRIEDELNKWY